MILNIKYSPMPHPLKHLTKCLIIYKVDTASYLKIFKDVSGAFLGHYTIVQCIGEWTSRQTIFNVVAKQWPTLH